MGGIAGNTYSKQTAEIAPNTPYTHREEFSLWRHSLRQHGDRVKPAF